jgi:hypothetical protein
MKSSYSFVLPAIIALSVAACGTSEVERPPLSPVDSTSLTAGTLANAALTRDAAREIGKTVGADRPEFKYITRQPIGPPGKKTWQELWTYGPLRDVKMYLITFREDGRGSTGFQIERVSGGILSGPSKSNHLL